MSLETHGTLVTRFSAIASGTNFKDTSQCIIGLEAW